jgi:hypothetical protein
MTCVLSFVTAELGDLGPGGTIRPEKQIGPCTGCQCPSSPPTVTWNLLIYDNDEGDLANFLIVVETGILEAADLKETAKALKEFKNGVRNAGKDTTGPSPFKELRDTAGDDVGESIKTNESL